MKKIHALAAAMFLFALVVFYLLGCFIWASFDISKWDIVGRGFIGSFGLILSAMAGAIVIAEGGNK